MLGRAWRYWRSNVSLSPVQRNMSIVRFGNLELGLGCEWQDLGIRVQGSGFNRLGASETRDRGRDGGFSCKVKDSEIRISG